MQSWFELIVKESPDFLMLLDEELKIVFINRTVNGVMAEDLIGTYIPTLAGPQIDLVEQKLQTALESKKPQTYTTHYDDPYEKRHYFSTTAIPLEAEINGACLYLVSRETETQ